VPDNIIERVKDDHKQAQTVRGQACSAAAKVRQMQAQAARQQQAPGGFGGNGGDLVSGAMRVPQGAL
jgi:hypothetical protein